MRNRTNIEVDRIAVEKEICISKSKVINILLFLSLLFAFLINGTVYFVYFNKVTDYFLMISVVCCFIALILNNKIYLNFFSLAVVVLYSVILVFSTAITGFNFEPIVKICYWIYGLVLIGIIRTSNNNYNKIFFKICVYLTARAFINYLLNVLGFIEYLPITNTSSEKVYDYYAFNEHCFVFFKSFSYFSITDEISILRADAPFREPGMMQFYVNIGLGYSLFVYKNKKKNYTTLFLIMSLLSFSLLSIVALFGILLLYLYQNKNKKTFFILIVFGILVGSIFLIEKLDTTSFSRRILDYNFMIKKIFEKFPFGYGVGNHEIIGYQYVPGFGYDKSGLYCGLLSPFLEVGIFGLVYYYIMLKGLYNNSMNNSGYRNVLIFIVIVTLLMQPLTNELLLFMLYYDGLINCDKKIKEVNYGCEHYYNQL